MAVDRSGNVLVRSKVGTARRGRCSVELKHSVELPVQFRDVDSLGHVNSAVYLQYMETARIEFMRRVGQIKAGFRPDFIIASCRCEYRKTITDEHRIVVSVWSSRIGERSWDFDYEVKGSTGDLFAIGRTTQVAYDYISQSKLAISPKLMGLLKKYSGSRLKFRDATLS
jgi:acyl-CoA thioester hydrolase